MKKIFTIILGVFLCTQAFAQINVNAGYVNSAFRASESGISVGTNGNGLYVGLSTDIKSANYPQVSFEPGLNFNLVDYKFDSGMNTLEYFLTAPLHVKYILPVAGIGDVFVAAGPTLLCTLGNTSKISYDDIGTITMKEKGGEFDVPIGVEGGIVLANNVKIAVGYDYGLINQNTDELRITRNFFHIGFGYSF